MNERHLSENSPRHVYNVLALRRSGQHGIIHWLIKSLEQAGYEDVGHANNVFEFCHNRFQHDVARALTARQAMFEAEYPDILVANYEDITYVERVFSPAYSEFLAAKTPRNDLIVVRDIYNLLASRLQKCRHDGMMSWRNPEKLEPAWNDHARQHSSDSLTFVNYNQWVQSPERRGELAQELGLTSAEDAVREVPLFGDGSSFDGRMLHGQAMAMNVLARWRNLDEELRPRFAHIVGNLCLKTVKLNQKLFGIHRDQVLGEIEPRASI